MYTEKVEEHVGQEKMTTQQIQFFYVLNSVTTFGIQQHKNLLNSIMNSSQISHCCLIDWLARDCTRINHREAKTTLK